jgi:hypothetical protein
MPLDNEDAAPAEKAKSEPSKRGGKPGFDEFLASLHEAIAGTTSSTKQLSGILRLLRKGFKVEKEITSAHIDAITQELAGYGDVEALVLRLFIEYPKAGKHLAVFVRNRLSMPFSASRGFPVERRKDDDRLFDLRQWIQSGNTERDPNDERYPEEWVRHACICLANEPDEAVRCQAINLLLRAVEQERQHGRGEERDHAHDYVKAVASLVLANSIDELVKGRVLLYPELVTQEELRAARRKSDSARIDAEDRCSRAEATVTQLTQRLQAVTTRVISLEVAIAEEHKRLEEALAAASQREEHLKHEWQQRLSAQRHTVSKHMLHDIEEAIMCLDRKDPNVEMALSRIRNAEKAIRDLE